MKIDPIAGYTAVHSLEEKTAAPKTEKAQQPEKVEQPEKPASDKAARGASRSGDVLFISADGLRQMLDKLNEKENTNTVEAQGTAFAAPGGAVDDYETNPQMLTRQLVASETQIQVMDTIGLANKALVKLRMALASASGDSADEIKAKIRKFEKVLTRAYRKIKDLGKEQVKREGIQEAKEKKDQQRAEKLKAELREMMRKRKKREEKYLRDKDDDDPKDPFKLQSIGDAASTIEKLDAAHEAMIASMAAQIIAAETGSAGVDVSAGGAEVSADGAAAAAGAEAGGGTFEGADIVTDGGGAEVVSSDA